MLAFWRAIWAQINTRFEDYAETIQEDGFIVFLLDFWLDLVIAACVVAMAVGLVVATAKSLT